MSNSNTQSIPQQTPSLAEQYASEALGIAWPAGAWPGAIGQQLILQQNVRRDWYHRPVIDYQTLPEAPRHRGHGQSIGWRRLPTEAERAGCLGAQAFDRSGDYCAAAHDAILPYGIPAWDSAASFEKRAGEGLPAGCWHVRVAYAGSPWDGYDLPSVCPEGDVWLWTPSLRAALACGYRVESAGGAILWSERHKLLGTWAERVWTARRALETYDSITGGTGAIAGPASWPDEIARREARELVKQVYVQTIGQFGHPPKEAAGTTDEERAADAGRPADLKHWQRPEWFCVIHAEALAYSFAIMRKAVAARFPPLWARLDTLGFASSTDPDITAGAAGLYTKVGALGAWRYDYSMPMSELLQTNGHKVTIEGRNEQAMLPAVRVRRRQHHG